MDMFSGLRSRFFAGIILILNICSFQQLTADPLHLDPQQEEKEQTLISQEVFSLFLGVDTALSADELEEYQRELEHFTKKLAKRKSRYSSEKQFLKYAFYKIHNRYLKHYTDHSSMYDLLDKGKYDCVTGSAFYALILDALGFEYVIKELPFHVYLLVQPDDAEVVLLESTDPREGYVAEAEKIQEMIRLYEQPLREQSVSEYEYGFQINEEIELKQLAALNYYNEAVDYYNRQNLKLATDYLDYASLLYPTKRMDALRKLINQLAEKPLPQVGM